MSCPVWRIAAVLLGVVLGLLFAMWAGEMGETVFQAGFWEEGI